MRSPLLCRAVSISVKHTLAAEFCLDLRIERVIGGVSRCKASVAAVARHFERVEKRCLVRHLGLDHVVMKVELAIGQRTDRLAVLTTLEISMISGRIWAFA